MTQEQRAKLEQAAKDYIKPFAHQLQLGADEGLIMDLVGFAQTILDNPQEWDLVRYEDYLKHSKRTLSENERYREALRDVINNCEDGAVRVIRIAKEALKNNEG